MESPTKSEDVNEHKILSKGKMISRGFVDPHHFDFLHDSNTTINPNVHIELYEYNDCIYAIFWMCAISGISCYPELCKLGKIQKELK